MKQVLRLCKRMTFSLSLVYLVFIIHSLLGQHCDKDDFSCDDPNSSTFNHINNNNAQHDNHYSKQSDINKSVGVPDIIGDNIVISENDITASLENLENNSADWYDGYSDKFKTFFQGKLTHPKDVVSPKPGAIDIGMILVNTKKTETFEATFARMTKAQLGSMLNHANPNTPLHLIYITDKFSAKQVGKLIGLEICKRITMDVLTNIWSHKIGVPLYFTLVDYHEIKDQKPEFVNVHRWLNGTGGDAKYDEDFFYIAPLYHLAFTQIQKLIVLDVQDLEFKVDISELYDEFDKMEPENILSIGNDLSLHYRVMLNQYIIDHPGTELGMPGRFQGFNCGVVLYHLVRMRNNELYNKYLHKDEVMKLLDKYGYKATLAEQDWMTNLGYSHPELIHILPCQFNAQTSIQYMKNEWLPVFDEYHFCDKWKNLKIIHFNGCGPMPEHCGNNPTHKSKLFKEGAYFNIGVGIDWRGLEMMRRGEVSVFFADIDENENEDE